jgi:hypothetical protein
LTTFFHGGHPLTAVGRAAAPIIPLAQTVPGEVAR